MSLIDTLKAAVAALLPDNTSGRISPQDLRDADNLIIDQIYTGDEAEAAARQTAINTESTARQAADTELQSQVDAFGNGQGKTFLTLGTGSGEAMEAPVPADNVPFRIKNTGSPSNDGEYIYDSGEGSGYLKVGELSQPVTVSEKDSLADVGQAATLDPTNDAVLATQKQVKDFSYSIIRLGAEGEQMVNSYIAIYAIVDDSNRVLMFFDENGKGHVPNGFKDLINGFQDVTLTGSTTDVEWGVRDVDGRIAIHIDSSGDFHVKKLYAQNTDLELLNDIVLKQTTELLCLGDSLTEGAGGTPFPTQLATLLPTRTVINSGFGSQRSTDISARFGALPISLTVSGNEIPTSGAVNVTITSGNDPLKHPANDKSILGTLAGVYGTLSKVFATGQYSFTRYLSGDAVTTTAENFFVSNDDARKQTPIIWIGRNDVTDGDLAIRTVVNQVKRIVNHLTPLQSNFVILTVTNATTEDNTTANYDRVIAINEAIEDAFPANFIDIRGVLATEPDGTIPTSLMADTIHLNTDGYEIVAETVHNFLILKGY